MRLYSQFGLFPITPSNLHFYKRLLTSLNWGHVFLISRILCVHLLLAILGFSGKHSCLKIQICLRCNFCFLSFILLKSNAHSRCPIFTLTPKGISFCFPIILMPFRDGIDDRQNYRSRDDWKNKWMDRKDSLLF